MPAAGAAVEGAGAGAAVEGASGSTRPPLRTTTSPSAALALQCTVPADHEALQRASAALGEVVVSNGGRVLPDAPVAAAPVPAPEPAPVAGAGAEGGALRWMLAALGGNAD